MASNTDNVHAALAPFKAQNKRLLRGSAGEAYTARDVDGTFRYVYDNYELDERSSVDSRLPTTEIVRYGNFLMTYSPDDTHVTHERRVEFIEEALDMPDSEVSVKSETLRHLGLVAVLPPEAKSSIMDTKLPETAAGPQDLKNAA